MAYKKPDAELCRLITALCDGHLDPEEHRRLEAMLADDPESRSFYYEYVALHAELSWSNAAGESRKALLELESNRAKGDGPAAPAKSPILGFLGECFEQGFGFTQNSGSLWTFLFILLGAGGILCPLMLLVQHPTAKIIATVDCKWSENSKTFADNAKLECGETVKLDSGLAKIAFDDRAEVILEGPAEFRVESDMSAKLLYGRLSAKVTDKGHGFTIYGPEMRVLDLGTEFGLNVDPSGRSQVHVFKGEVEVALMRKDGLAIRSQLISQHKAAAIDLQGREIGDLRLDPAEFIRTFEASDLDITREYVQAVKALYPVAYWRFEYLADGLVLNEMSDRYHGHSPTQLVLSRDVQNKTLAVDHRRENKQYMEVLEPLEELVDSDLSIEFWIKPDEYQWTTPVVLFQQIPEKDKPEPVSHLVELLPTELMRTGQPVQTVRLLHRLPASWVYEDGTSCFSDEKYKPGHWHHIVGAFDGKQMRLYLNAHLVAAAEIHGRLNFAPCISIGRMPNYITKNLRQLNKDKNIAGQIDEVAIYNRALSVNQVAEHYQLGKKVSCER